MNKVLEINNLNIYEKLCLFVAGVFLASFSFNVFFAANDIVTGGVSGIAIIINDLFGINMGVFIFVASFVLILFSYFLLGKEATINAILGSILFPLFIECSRVYADFVIIEDASLLIMVLFGGMIYGFANGLIFKTGLSLGGIQIISQILQKFLKISMGNATILANSVIIIIGGYIFGFNNCLYAIIGLYMMSVVMDRVLLGISDKKAFYIITDKEKEVLYYLEENFHEHFTSLVVRGGYTNTKRKMLMCVIPTREYVLLKEIVLEIDKDAFFLITDTYEVFNGKMCQIEN